LLALLQRQLLLLHLLLLLLLLWQACLLRFVLVVLGVQIGLGVP
jgi:hypothetical protein